MKSGPLPASYPEESPRKPMRFALAKTITERRAPAFYRVTRGLYHTPTLAWRNALTYLLPTEEQMLRLVDRSFDEVFFVQIGAHDGKTGDHLRSFVLERGWKGVLVEPVTAMFQRLVENYAGVPGLTFVQAAIANYDGEVKFWRSVEDAPQWMGALGSLKREVIERHVKEFTRYFASDTVPCLTFHTLIRQAGVRRLNVVLIDTEGYDYEILRQIDFPTHRPSLVMYEQRHLSRGDKRAAVDLLKRHGYRVKRTGDGLNNAAIMKN
ncbi:MAG TPA: FkbM family methyltransferase [Stellaceae bacterium]|nr:FkbM family methyltransferase [Stellaceae bacterium]